MTITHNNMVPGLFSKGIEFIAVDFNKVQAMHDRQVLGFSHLPEFAYSTIKSLMGNSDATIEEMEVYAFRRWGGMDNTPDIDESGNPSDPEYLNDVNSACFDNGNKISDAEIRVLKLISFEDNTIADKLFLSRNTVARHIQSMFIKSGISLMTGQNKRSVLALWATKKGII